jgi:hypothetical protein
MAKFFRPLALSCLMLGIPGATAARADSITVTSGSADVAWDDPSSFFVANAGAGFELSGLFSRVALSPQDICFAGCAPGTVVDLSAVFGGPFDGSLGVAQRATIEGVSIAVPSDPETWLSLSGALQFDAGSVVLPPFEGQDPLSLTAPFTFNGEVAGFTADDPMPRFFVALDGRGTARLVMSRIDGTDLYGFPSATYGFNGAEPVPEPATVILLGSGLGAALLGRAHRTRRRRHTSHP